MRNRSGSRLTIVKIIFAIVWAVFIGRLIMLQVIERDRFLRVARDQQNLFIELQAKRGVIFDRNYRILAQDIDSYSYYIVPEKIKNKKAIARKLAKITGSANLRNKFDSHPKFLWVARKADKEIAEALEGAGIETLNRLVEPKRIYPSGRLALALLGRVDIDNNGLSGIELQYDKVLKGRNGKTILRRDALGNCYLFDDEPLAEPRKGSDLVLTVDLDLQQIVEQELAAALVENNAAYGNALFIMAGTAEILACASLDSLGEPATRNRAITDQYEPGSTFKVVAVAAALADRLFEPSDILFVENGEFRIGRRVIRDDHEYDSLTVEDIIVHSSNIGAAKMALAVGDEPIYKIIKEAGFVMPLGVDFPAEAGGYLQTPKWRDHYLANVAFGHGISATLLQIATLYEAIALDGCIYHPFFGKEIIEAEGKHIQLNQQYKIRRIFSQKTAATIRQFLDQVVVRGTAMKARSDIVPIAGKTGTALKLSEKGRGYDHKRARASFVGYFPSDNPMVVGVVFFDEPKDSRYGGETAAPVFKRIAERYYSLPQLMANRVISDDEYNNIQLASYAKSRSEFVKILEASARYYGEAANDNTIPDFAGLTIRQALALASMKGMELDIEGSGVVNSQLPAAGQPYRERVTIKLRCEGR
jgi:cell division protein FtsI (penicillin-binding protein 3)